MNYTILEKIYYSNRESYEETYLKRFNSYSTFKYDINIKNNQAFCMLDSEILELTNNIYKINTKIENSLCKLPDLAKTKYQLRCLIDEIELTNKIESINSTRKEINEVIDIINNSDDKRYKRFLGIISKYIKLNNIEFNENNDIKTCNDVRKIYDDIFLKEIEKENNKDIPDGEIFRANPVYVVSDTQKTIHTGVFPESKIISDMTAALNILNESKNSLINIAIFHYLFGYIHPFYDGNGRLNRFISSYYLSKEVNQLVGYKLSVIIKKNINEYYRSFKQTNEEINKGDLTSFVIGFLNTVYKACITVNDELTELYTKYMYYYDIINKKYKSDNEKSILNVLIINTLFGENGLTINDIKEITNIGMNSIRDFIHLLYISNKLKCERNGRKNEYFINLNNLEEN